MDPNKLFSGTKMRLDKTAANIQKILTEAVITLCQTGVPFDAELTVEGLLGITADKDNIILVNIKEIIRHDMPKDYSKKGTTEKRKAQVDGGVLTKRHKDGNGSAERRRTMPHSFVPEGYNSQEDSQDTPPSGSSLSLNGGSMMGMKIPLIPPELHNASANNNAANNGPPQQVRQKHLTDVREKHLELSRMLNAQKQALEQQQQQLQQQRPKSAASMSDDVIFSPEGGVTIQEAHTNKDGTQRPQSALNLAHEYISPRSVSVPQPSSSPFTSPIDLAGSMSSIHSDRSGGPSPLMMAADLSMGHAPSPRPFPSPLGASFPGSEGMPPYMVNHAAFQHVVSSSAGPTSQPIGVVLDTNVQPPAPLAVVAGTGVLTAVNSAMQQPKPEYDFLNDLPEGTAVVQPVEIVPEVDIRTLQAQQQKRERQQQARKERAAEKAAGGAGAGATDKMGRPKKSKEFCRFRCTICNASSSRKFNLQRHVNSHHPNAVNAIIDLTPPKNPRQVNAIRHKMPGDVKFNPFDGSTFHMMTPEGVSIDSAMDLSVSPSPDKMAGMETESNVSDYTEELTPPSSVGIVFPTDSATPPPILAKPQQGLAATHVVTEDPASAKKRFNKGKKSLDNMLFNKFGNYMNTATAAAPNTSDVSVINGGGDVTEKNDVITDNDDVTDDDALVIDTSADVTDGGEKQMPAREEGELVLEEESSEMGPSAAQRAPEKALTAMKPMGDMDSLTNEDSNETASLHMDEGVSAESKPGDEPKEIEEEEDVHNTSNIDYESHGSFNLDPVSGSIEVTEKRTSGASDGSIEKDANANNKNDLVANLNPTPQSSPTADLNGNSKASKATPPDQNTPIPSTSDTEASPEKAGSTTIKEVESVDEPAVDAENMQVDYADDDNDEEEDEAILNEPETDDAKLGGDIHEQLEKVSTSESNVDNVDSIESKLTPKTNTSGPMRMTRRSQSSALENTTEDSYSSETKESSSSKVVPPLSPRKNSPTKAAVIREPIKTRTFTRASSVTTRRNSTQKEIETK